MLRYFNFEPSFKTMMVSCSRIQTEITIPLITMPFSDVFRPFGRPVYRFGRQNSGGQIKLFLFSVVLQQKLR